jgi:cyclophilin family peptidyl-prolyl cis-trans isomerase
MLDSAPHLDQKYTIFGEVVSGFDVIDRIVGMPQSKPFTPDERVEIKSAEITFSNNFALGPVNPSMSMK